MNTILVPNVGPLLQTRQFQSHYSNPTLKSAKSAKSTKLHKTAGGSVQIKIHKHFEGDSVQEEGIPVAEIVRKLADPPVPSTTIQVIGTVILDPVNCQEFVSTFNASRQCEQ